MSLRSFILSFRKNYQGRRFYRSLGIEHVLCFDCGANIGKRSSLLLNLGCRVVAIEPQPSCVEILNKLKKLNWNERLEIVPVAVAEKTGCQEMHISNVSEVSTLSTDFIETYSYQQELNWNSRTQVITDTLDNLIVRYGLPKYCKLDLEGYEVKALQGLSIAIPIISFEFNKPLMKDARACIALLSDLGEYQFNLTYYEEFKFRSGWLRADDVIRFCSDMPGNILTGEIFAKRV